MSAEYPSISVVTPSFNQVEFIEETFRSIHESGYPNLEHIVIDGGSTDGSVEVIERYSKDLAHWVSEPDDGQTDALIKGFEVATGEILCWLNSDDLFEPRTLFEVAEYVRSDPEVRFVYGDSIWIDSKSRVIKPKREQRWSRFVWLHDHNFIPQPSAFWTRELYEEVGGLDRRFDIAMDADLWIRFSERTLPRHVRKTWSRMRFYPQQKNTRLKEASLLEMRSIRDRYVEPASPAVEALRSSSARLLRVGAKALGFGYSMREVATHLGHLSGAGSWEDREAARHGKS